MRASSGSYESFIAIAGSIKIGKQHAEHYHMLLLTALPATAVPHAGKSQEHLHNVGQVFFISGTGPARSRKYQEGCSDEIIQRPLPARGAGLSSHKPKHSDARGRDYHPFTHSHPRFCERPSDRAYAGDGKSGRHEGFRAMVSDAH